MEHRTLGKTGLSVSTLGFGAAPIGLLGTEQERAADVLRRLLDAGVNLIDTAASYKGSEEAIGRAVGHRRAEFVLVSKCGRAEEDLPGESWSPRLIAATVDRALRRLRTDHLDVMLLHSAPRFDVLEAGDALGALVAARDAGKVRFVGVSGDNDDAAFAAALPDVAVVETSVNICDQANLDAVLPVARARGVGVLAKRPVANAAWRAPEAQQGFYQDYSRPYHARLAAMGVTPESLGLADLDWHEIALRFTLAQPGVHCAIVGTTSPENAARNVAAAARGPLPAAAVRAIREAFARAEARSGEPCWPALR